jgi:hypothetical protein
VDLLYKCVALLEESRRHLDDDVRLDTAVGAQAAGELAPDRGTEHVHEKLLEAAVRTTSNSASFARLCFAFFPK